MNENIYLTGGIVRSDKGYVKLNNVLVFSTVDNTAKLHSHMNCRRVDHGCCEHAGSIFVCGGKEGTASTCCEKLNIVEGKWEFVTAMKEARKLFQTVSCGKYMWAFGGRSGKNAV